MPAQQRATDRLARPAARLRGHGGPKARSSKPSATTSASAETSSNGATPISCTSNLVTSGPNTAPPMPPSAISENTRRAWLLPKMSAMTLQNSDTTNRLNTLTQTKNTTPSVARADAVLRHERRHEGEQAHDEEAVAPASSWRRRKRATSDAEDRRQQQHHHEDRAVEQRQRVRADRAAQLVAHRPDDVVRGHHEEKRQRGQHRRGGLFHDGVAGQTHGHIQRGRGKPSMRLRPARGSGRPLGQLRLRDRRRRFGRLRAGRSAQRRIRRTRVLLLEAGPPRLESADPHARRPRAAGQQSPRQLELPHRTGAGTAASAACGGRAAGPWAVPVRSTRCATCAASPPTTTAGLQQAAIRAGRGNRCCRGSCAARTTVAAPARCTASAARSAWRTCVTTTRCRQTLHRRRGERRSSAQRRISTARSRPASACTR